MIADLSREKLTLQPSQNSVLLYGCSCLSVINEASLLKTTGAIELMAKGTKLNFPNALFICTFLLQFSTAVALW